MSSTDKQLDQVDETSAPMVATGRGRRRARDADSAIRPAADWSRLRGRAVSNLPASATNSATEMRFCKRDWSTFRLVGVAVVYVATAALANWATSAYGLVPAGFGLTVTAGTYLAGLTLALRDAAHDTAGIRGALVLVLLGSAASTLFADLRIALASGIAFLLAELLDMAVYTPLRRRGRRRAVAVSGAVGAVTDSVVFLLASGFPFTAASLGGQLLVKAVWVTGAYLAVAEVTRRALPRERVVTADPRSHAQQGNRHDVHPG